MRRRKRRLWPLRKTRLRLGCSLTELPQGPTGGAFLHLAFQGRFLQSPQRSLLGRGAFGGCLALFAFQRVDAASQVFGRRPSRASRDDEELETPRRLRLAPRLLRPGRGVLRCRQRGIGGVAESSFSNKFSGWRRSSRRLPSGAAPPVGFNVVGPGCLVRRVPRGCGFVSDCGVHSTRQTTRCLVEGPDERRLYSQAGRKRRWNFAEQRTNGSSARCVQQTLRLDFLKGASAFFNALAPSQRTPLFADAAKASCFKSALDVRV